MSRTVEALLVMVCVVLWLIMIFGDEIMMLLTKPKQPKKASDDNEAMNPFHNPGEIK